MEKKEREGEIRGKGGDEEKRFPAADWRGGGKSSKMIVVISRINGSKFRKRHKTQTAECGSSLSRLSGVWVSVVFLPACHATQLNS